MSLQKKKRMSKKNKKNVVYSTNPDFDYEYDEKQEEETLPAKEQHLKLYKDRKHRKGKTAILVKGFIGTEEDLKALGKQLKQKCAVGGSAKDAEIILQGEVREKVMNYLKKQGYNCKKVGG